jgi:hypothetical protein
LYRYVQAKQVLDDAIDKVGPLYKSNPALTHSLKAPGFNP